MKVLKKFGEFFKKKPTQKLDQYDVEEIQFMLSEFMKDFIMNNDDFEMKDFDISVILKENGSSISAKIIINPMIEYRARFGKVIIAEVKKLILKSTDYADLKFRIKQSYKLTDTMDFLEGFGEDVGAIRLELMTPVISLKITR